MPRPPASAADRAAHAPGPLPRPAAPPPPLHHRRRRRVGPVHHVVVGLQQLPQSAADASFGLAGQLHLDRGAPRLSRLVGRDDHAVGQVERPAAEALAQFPFADPPRGLFASARSAERGKGGRIGPVTTWGDLRDVGQEPPGGVWHPAIGDQRRANGASGRLANAGVASPGYGVATQRRRPPRSERDSPVRPVQSVVSPSAPEGPVVLGLPSGGRLRVSPR